ncbi:MAG: VOC family protein [Acidobacteriia bacterium]|nr:VOC family protein [Terriglobia bacterium]
MNRRQLVTTIAAAAAAVGGAASSAEAAGKGFKAVTVNHISYNVADYTKTRDFYADLMGMAPKQDDGKNQCYMAFGDTFLLPRNARGQRQPPLVDHIAYTIEGWNTAQVEDELKRRGYKKMERGEKGGPPTRLGPMQYRPDTENSFHILDPDGFDLQISGKDMKA